MVIYIVITENCNLECLHCIRGNQRDSVMESADFMRIVRQFSSSDKVDAVILTGGEPLLHPQFYTILEYALEFFPKRIIITTNGTLPMDDILSIGDKFDKSRISLQVSLEGVSTINDKIRGLGSFIKTYENILRLNKNGFSPSISTTATKYNINGLLDLAHMLCDVKISGWKVSLAQPIGMCSDNLIPNLDLWNFIVSKINKMNLPYRVNAKKIFDISFLDSLQDSDLKRVENIFVKNGLRNCGIGREKLYIYPNLSVSACTCLASVPIGNMQRENFSDLLQSSPFVNMANCQLEKNSPCLRCKYVKLCNGGCPGMSYAKFGHIGVGDIRCSLFRKLANEQGILF